MDKLPPEVLSRIVHFLVPDNGLGVPITSLDKPWQGSVSIASYATVSKQWQPHVERLTFANLCLSAPRLPTARRILSPLRLRYVRIVDLDVVLEEYGEEAACRIENDEEKRRNDELFTQTVAGLFVLLKELDTSESGSDGKTLRLRGYSPSDAWRLPDFPRLRRMRRNYLTDNLLDARYTQSYLGLGESLPCEVATFSTFEVPDPATSSLKYRRISPSACCTIASSLSKLEKISWHLSDNEKKDFSLRKDLRREFSAHLTKLPQSLKHVILRYTRTPPKNHAVSPVSIVEDGSSIGDPLSLALRSLCGRLVTADLQASLDSVFFSPTTAESDSREEMQWPSLQKLKLGLSAVTPSGKWLLERHRDARQGQSTHEEDDQLRDDEPDTPADEDRKVNEFRGSPNVPAVKSWFLTAAKAALQMPSLLQMEIGTGCGETPKPYRAWCGLQYSAHEPLLEIISTPVLDVEGELAETWKAVAAAHAQASTTLAIKCKEADSGRAQNHVVSSTQGTSQQRAVFGATPVQNSPASGSQPSAQSRPVFGAQGTGQNRPVFGAQETGQTRPVFGAQGTGQSQPVFGAQGTGHARPVFGAQGTGLSRPVFGAQGVTAVQDNAQSDGLNN